MKKILCMLAFVVGCSDSNVSKLNHNYDLTNSDVISGSILVDAKDNVSESDIKDLENIAGTHFHVGNATAKQYKYADAVVNVANEQSILDRLNADPRVEHAEPMVKVHALWTPNDPQYHEQYGLTRVGAESAWSMSCGMGVKIAVVDTGVDTKLADLAGTKFDDGYNFVNNNTNVKDLNGHGSHCTGSVAQTTNNNLGGAGMSYCATIIPVRVLDENGSGSMEGVAEGIRFAADHGAQVISLSLGSSHPSDVVRDAIYYAYDMGVVIVAANGNDSGPIGYPAAYSGVMAISAIDSTDTIANFSSRGPETAIASPGVDVGQWTICDKKEGCFKKFSGTSMATPIVAGAAGMVVSAGITNPDAVRARLQGSADHMDDSDLYGSGILRADSAVSSTIFNHLIWRLVALAGILVFLHKKIDMNGVKSKLSVVGTVFAGFGLVPLFFVGLLPRLGSFRVFGELAARPVLEWLNVFGFAVKYLPLANFLPAGLAVLLVLNSRFKSFGGGMALGSAALLTQMFVSNDVNYFAGSLVMRVMLAVSVGVCIYFTKVSFAKGK